MSQEKPIKLKKVIKCYKISININYFLLFLGFYLGFECFNEKRIGENDVSFEQIREKVNQSIISINCLPFKVPLLKEKHFNVSTWNLICLCFRNNIVKNYCEGDE